MATIILITGVIINFNLHLMALNLLKIVSINYPLGISILISSILFAFSYGLFDYSAKKEQQLHLKKIDLNVPIKINMHYFEHNTERIEETRMQMWRAYTSNAQNHASYLLTTIVALIAFVAGWDVLLTDIVMGMGILIAITLILVGIYGWLIVRSCYWHIRSDIILKLTHEDMLKLFNDYNGVIKYYHNNLPPCSAVILFSLEQFIINRQDKLRWVSKNFIEKLAIASAGKALIKKAKKNNQEY